MRVLWRWLGEYFGAAWGLEAQLMVALQNIDMVGEKKVMQKKKKTEEIKG